MGSRRGGAPRRIQGVGSGLRGGEKVLRRGRHRKHFRRYRQIVEVFLRHGFGYTVERLDLGHLIPMWRRFRRVQEGRATGLPAVRLRSAFEELGATFIKLGQLLSTRADLVPPEIVRELAKLQDEVAPFPTEEAVALIEAELGIALDDAFAHFDGTPLAAGSIAQVHRARLHSGEEVVVKLQRPGVAAQIRTDVEILSGLARIVQDRLRPEMVNIVDFVDEFRRYIMNELDFAREGRNIERFRGQFQDDPYVVIPKVFWEFSTDRMLTMEYVEGVKAFDVEAVDRLGIDRRRIAIIGAEAFLKQVMVDGCFHGDPHPGNVFVLPGERIAYVDFGVVGRVSAEVKENLAALFVGIVRRDMDRVVKAMTRLGAVDDRSDMRRLREDIADMIDRHYGKSLKEIKAATILSESFELAGRHRIRLPSDLLLLGRALVLIEGMGERLDPDFNVLEIAEPFARRLLAERYDPKNVVRRASEELIYWAQLARELPGRVDRLLDQTERGRLRIQFIHRGLEELIHRLDFISNRIALAVVIASLVIGSSLVMQSSTGPFIRGLPAIGVLGYVAAFLLGIWLAVSILRSGRF